MYYESPIVYIIFNKDVELGFPEIADMIHHTEKLSKGKNYFVFSDIRAGGVDVTQEGRRMASKASEAPYQKGTAVLASNALYQLAANVFANFNKPKYPYRVFTNKQKAIEWLLSLPLNNRIEKLLPSSGNQK